MSRKGVHLDVDSSIIENKLLLNKDESMGDFDDLLKNSLLNYKDDSAKKGKMVQAKPGIVIKVWKENGDKVFINLCHTEHIPEPNEISESDLFQLLLNFSDDKEDILDNDYRIPMSIGTLHMEKDKRGKPCEVCDVIINTEFFNNKVSKIVIFERFVANTILRGVLVKHSLPINIYKELVVLKNCRVMGKIEPQMIEVRDSGSKIKDEDNTNKNSSVSRPLIEEIGVGNRMKTSTSISQPSNVYCPYQILLDPESIAKSKSTGSKINPNSLTVNIALDEPAINSGKDVVLDLCEDRLLLRSASLPNISDSDLSNKERILLDIFLPYNIVCKNSKAQFNTDNKVLSVCMPVEAR